MLPKGQGIFRHRGTWDTNSLRQPSLFAQQTATIAMSYRVKKALLKFTKEVVTLKNINPGTSSEREIRERCKLLRTTKVCLAKVKKHLKTLERDVADVVMTSDGGEDLTEWEEEATGGAGGYVEEGNVEKGEENIENSAGEEIVEEERIGEENIEKGDGEEGVEEEVREENVEKERCKKGSGEAGQLNNPHNESSKLMVSQRPLHATIPFADLCHCRLF